MRYLLPVSLVPVLLALTGCALNVDKANPTNVTGSSFQGSVYGGQQPVTASTVKLYAVGTSGYGTGATLLATTTTDSHGNFNFASGAYTCPYSNTPLYLTATGGNSGYGTGSNTAIALAASIGICSAAPSVNVNLNEVTTAATAFALSHFFTTTLGTGSTDAFGGTAPGSGTYNAGLVLANNVTVPNLVTIASGTARTSTATVTRESAKLYTIANIIAACVNSTGGVAGDGSNCGTLFAATKPPVSGSTAPTDTLQAAVQMALYPYQNVSTLFNLAPATSPFVGLSNTPNDFTIGVSYTSSSFGLAINGSGASGASNNIDIDANGKVWFPSNSASGKGLGYFDPSALQFGGPYVTSLVHSQYVAVDNTGMIYGTDLSSPIVAGTPSASPGTVTTVNLPTGAFAGPINATSNADVSNALAYIVTNGANVNLYLVFSGTQNMSTSLTYPANGIATYNNGNPSSYFEAEASTNGTSTSCLLEGPYTYQGENYPQVITTSTSPCVSGGIAQLNETANESALVASSLNQICSYLSGTCFAPGVPLSTPEGIVVDGDSNVWISNAGNASISTLFYGATTHTSADYNTTSPVAYIHNSTNGGTLVKPYGIAIDNSGNVWTANAGCVGIGCTPTSFVLSELVGAAAPTVTPLATATFSPSNNRPTK